MIFALILAAVLEWTGDILNLPRAEVEKGVPCRIKASVTLVEPDGSLVVETVGSGGGDRGGVYVKTAPTKAKVGSSVIVQGRTFFCGEKGIAAGEVIVRDESRLPQPGGLSAWDIIKGKCLNRRGWMEGTVVFSDSGAITFESGKKILPVTVLGSNISYPEGALLRLTGVVRHTYDEKGRFLAARFVVPGPDGVEVIATPKVWLVRTLVAVAAAVLAFAFVVLFALWIRAARKARALKILTEERRRMAGELHDTLEQHLAGAKILIAGAMRVKEMPPKSAALLAQAAEVLANAKVEVRDAVMDLRESSEARSLEESLAELAAGIRKTGIAVRMKLIGKEPVLHAAARHDVVAVAREAATNAVKHGGARTIVFAADGNVLRVLNDGAKFDAAKALGPETGHFGLSGMRERAARSGFKLEFIDEVRWCGVRITL